MRASYRLLAAALLAFSLSGCGDTGSSGRGPSGSPQQNGTAPAKQTAAEPSLLYTQTAAGGTLKPINGQRFTLTLSGVAEQTVWFQDRPGRKAGHQETAEFVRAWKRMGFDDDPPNAALQILDGAERADTLVVELLDQPVYDSKRHTLRYTVRMLQEPIGLAGLRADASVPRQFRGVSMFIDNAPGAPQPGSYLTEDDFSATQGAEGLLTTTSSSDWILLFFTANWCGPCRTTDQELSKYMQRGDAITVYRLDVDDAPRVAERLGARQMPTMLVYQGRRYVTRLLGAQRSATIAATVNAAR